MARVKTPAIRDDIVRRSHRRREREQAEGIGTEEIEGSTHDVEPPLSQTSPKTTKDATSSKKPQSQPEIATSVVVENPKNPDPKNPLSESVQASGKTSSSQKKNPSPKSPKSPKTKASPKITKAFVKGSTSKKGSDHDSEQRPNKIPDLNITAEEVCPDSPLKVEDYFLSDDDDCEFIFDYKPLYTHSPPLLCLTWPFDDSQRGHSVQPNSNLEDQSLEELDIMENVEESIRRMSATLRQETDAVASTQHQDLESDAHEMDIPDHLGGKEGPASKKQKTTKSGSKANVSGTEKGKGKQVRKKSIATKKPKKKKGNATASIQQSKAGTSLPHFIPRPQRPRDGFSKVAAKDLYQSQIRKVGLIDKGFGKVSIEEFEFIRNVIQERSWEKFCEVKTSYNLTLIREFYAEFPFCTPPLIMVRGVGVHISSDDINHMLGLPSLESTDYEKLTKEATLEELDNMIKVVGRPGSKWDHHPNFRLRTIKAVNLLPDANVWMNFIKSSLWPTTHDSTLSCEKVVLLYCLMSGKSINVGKLIYEKIVYCSKRNQGKFFFPGLLSKFLTAAGIPQYDEDVILSEGDEKWELDMKSVVRLRQGKSSRDDIVEMMQDILSQNSSIIDALTQHEMVFEKKMKELTEELEGIKKGSRMGDSTTKVLSRLRHEKTKNRRLMVENDRLKAEKESLLKEKEQLVNAAALKKAPPRKRARDAGASKGAAKDSHPTLNE